MNEREQGDNKEGSNVLFLVFSHGLINRRGAQRKMNINSILFFVWLPDHSGCPDHFVNECL